MKKAKKNKKTKGTDKFILALILVSFLVLGGGIFLAGRIQGAPDIAVSQNAKAQAVETKHDWGEIKLNDGEVKKTFTIKNTGTEPLKLANVKTSCMCTTAQVILNGTVSPKFGMHTNSSWQGEVFPGEEAVLEVVFDPAYHGPSGIGTITREVAVETNDSENQRLIFILTADVVN